jgi:hypothetical protein
MHVIYSADPDDISAQIDLIGMPWLKVGFESLAAQTAIARQRYLVRYNA